MPTYESLPAESEFFKGNLFQKMVDDLRLAGKAKRTVYGYLRAVRKLADYCQKSPDQIHEQDVRQYLLHLIVELEVATGTQTVALSGIKFFFRTTCPARLESPLTNQIALHRRVARSHHPRASPADHRRLDESQLQLRLADVVGWTRLEYTAVFQPEPRQRPVSECQRCGGELELMLITNQRGTTIWQRRPISSLQSPASSLKARPAMR